MMLIAESGLCSGLLSGGCLEGHLAEHGREVLQIGQSKFVRYDMHGPDDALFGLGSGRESSMGILLQRLDAASAWQPMSGLAAAWQQRRPECLPLVARADDPTHPAGPGVFSSAEIQAMLAGRAQIGSLSTAAAAAATPPSLTAPLSGWNTR
jgi:xanthine/CO dehydrogenase XdhC/CoxF family maturation factor